MDVAGGGARPCWVGRDRWRGEGGAFDANSDRTLKGGGLDWRTCLPTPAQKKTQGLEIWPDCLSQPSVAERLLQDQQLPQPSPSIIHLDRVHDRSMTSSPTKLPSQPLPPPRPRLILYSPSDEAIYKRQYTSHRPPPHPLRLSHLLALLDLLTLLYFAEMGENDLTDQEQDDTEHSKRSYMRSKMSVPLTLHPV